MTNLFFTMGSKVMRPNRFYNATEFTLSKEAISSIEDEITWNTKDILNGSNQQSKDDLQAIISSDMTVLKKHNYIQKVADNLKMRTVLAKENIWLGATFRLLKDLEGYLLHTLTSIDNENGQLIEKYNAMMIQKGAPKPISTPTEKKPETPSW